MDFILILCGLLFILSMFTAPITLIIWIILLIKKSEKKKKAKWIFLSTLGGFIVSTIIGVIIGIAASETCEHNWEAVVKTAATCTDNGTTTMMCTLCDSEETKTVPATGHSFTEEIVQAATCSATGTAKKTCSLCNQTEEIVLDKVEHTYKYTTTKAPTLEEKGIETGTCTVCGDTQEKEISKLGTKSNPAEVTASKLVAEINANKDAAKSKYNGKWIKITGKVLSANNVAGMTRFYLYGEHGGSGLRIVCWLNKEVLKPFDYTGETHTFIGQVREISTVNATEIGDCTIIK